MAKLSSCLLGLALAAGLAAPAGAQTNVAAGKTVTVGAGSVNGAAFLSTLTDGAFVPDQQSWTVGSVYWNGTDVQLYGTAVTSTPEPATVALLGLGLAGLGVAARRRRA